ncbi:phospholipase D endonuclease superfamily domain protein [Chlamydia suis MD56]|uniref:phospholipase D-like domain-containing protein n=1 Tax=Chlamydia suis TaxID=83559 RepID=UPI0003BFEDCC|nr:phospholipase D-like domain-containing protein [Chlamydia suis]ESN89653.1 phospholipase D endonuclease superfamily domain protein [Chlamydia suis MD56]
MSINRNSNYSPYQESSGSDSLPPLQRGPQASPEEAGAYFISPEELQQQELAAAIGNLSLGLQTSDLNPNAAEFTPRASSTATSHRFETFCLPYSSTSPQNEPFLRYLGSLDLYTDCPHNPYAPYEEPFVCAPYPADTESPQEEPCSNRNALEEGALVTHFAAHSTPFLSNTPSTPHLPGEALQLFSTQSGVSPLDVICDSIRLAQTELFFCIYKISSPKIIEAILERANAGVRVLLQYQFISNHESLLSHPNVILQQFESRRDALLHRKNVVIDNWLAILGSANFADGAFTRDTNLVAIVKSPSLCQRIQDRSSGPCTAGLQQLDYYILTRHKSSRTLQNIVTAIHSAEKTIRIAMFILSNRTILAALHEAAQRGVQVSVIVNPRDKHTPFEILHNLGSSVDLYEAVCEGFLHCKACCIDLKTLILSSANWTRRGVQFNIEDLLIIHKPTRRQLAVFFNLWGEILSSSRLVTAENAFEHKNKPSSSPEEDE